ncbi:metal-dependent hydrolase [Oceanicola sp. S124]|uniref:metal-dependent hydrolase n=1 Tax=Oceanicola sp. S124 TaxID=1042378 RepID=UPI000255A6E4|nr:metal-dependent hydrolase [Oceanicola sp. S124]
MFLAHLPAGYLLARQLAKRRALILTGCAASLLPDTDLLWFYLVDQRQTLHHAYVFHWPLFWIATALAGWGLARVLNRPRILPFLGVALACLLLHMVLDSLAGGIAWLAPLSDLELRLVEVPARHGWWVWNFVLHWTMLVEVLILAAFAIALSRDLRRPAPGAGVAP